jgi:uncharacterized membrane protein YjdF
MSQLNWRGYRQLAWVGELVLALAILVALVQGRWQNALGLGIFLLAALIFMLKADKLPSLFDLLFVIAALMNAGGWVWGWFHLPGLYDEITHAFTTFAITLALSFLVYQSMFRVFRQHTWLYGLTITSFGIAIGAFWEIIEWIAGFVLGSTVIGSLNDTIVDLMMDALGASLAALTSLWALAKWIQSRALPQTPLHQTYTHRHHP